jgi:hypothetical protein
MSCVPKRYLIPENRTTDSEHVLGLRGCVFGQHWGEPQGRKVNSHNISHLNWDVKIRWKSPAESNITYAGHNGDEPLILPYCTRWVMFNSDLSVVEKNLGFSIRSHVKTLISQNPSRNPVILEWGCGIGNAVNDLTTEPEIKGKALIFGYGDIWDVDWNKVDGVKFLFLVKEHLAEYLRRAGIQVDFIFTHGAMNYLFEEDLVMHLRDLATVMVPGGMLVIPPRTAIRDDLVLVKDLFTIASFLPFPDEPLLHMLTRK